MYARTGWILLPQFFYLGYAVIEAVTMLYRGKVTSNLLPFSMIFACVCVAAVVVGYSVASSFWQSGNTYMKPNIVVDETMAVIVRVFTSAISLVLAVFAYTFAVSLPFLVSGIRGVTIGFILMLGSAIAYVILATIAAVLSRFGPMRY